MKPIYRAKKLYSNEYVVFDTGVSTEPDGFYCSYWTNENTND